MTIVDKINEKTGKFANNITEAVADLLGKEVKATTILETLEEEGNSNNITEAIDNLANKTNSNNIAEAVDQYNGDDIPKSMTIEEALENIGEGPGPGPEPTPTEKLLFTGGAVEVEALEGSTTITPSPFTPVFTEAYKGDAKIIFHNYQEKIGDGEWEQYPTYEYFINVTCNSDSSYSIGEIHFPHYAYLSMDGEECMYVYENGDAVRYSKWDSFEVFSTNEELMLHALNTNLKEYESEHGLWWDYLDTVNNGDTLRVKLQGIVGHIESETETLNDIDKTGTVGFTVGTIDNLTFLATSGDGITVEMDPNVTPRYNKDIDIQSILVTRIPNEAAANSTTPNFNSMTKAEIQAWADENNISGVDQDSQTKAQMIETIEAALNA